MTGTVAVLLAIATACTTPADTRSPDLSSPERFEFGVFGDAPYDAAEEARVRRAIERMNEADLAFVVHIGDVQTGASSIIQHSIPTCTEESLEHRREIFAALRHPFILTPGDNDWTDCHSVPGRSLDPMEQLAKLRAMFFSENSGESAGGERLAFTTQAGYVENRQWVHGNVVFATLHIVGTNNNRGRTAEMDREYTERTAAARAWLSQAFRRARDERAIALVLFMHANPRFESTWSDTQAWRYMLGRPEGGSSSDPTVTSGYDDFLPALREETLAFSRPVLLVHGDTHTFRIDKPLAMQDGLRVVENFTRLETFGSPDVHWIRIDVDRSQPGVFSFSPQGMAEDE